jgi:cell division transport system permease protein
MLGFLRVAKFAIQDIARNASLSFMTVLVLVLMLLSVNTVIIVRTLTGEATNSIKERIDVSIYFDHTATQDQISEIESYVKAFPEVTKAELLSRESVLEEFKKKYDGNDEISAAIAELDENPLGATLVVKTREPGDYKKIIESLSVPEYEHVIESKTFEDTEQAIAKIDVIMSQVEKFSFALSAFFAFIAFIIIFNTVRVAIYTQRIEISIKKLVGATNWFIRGPYAIEALIFSLISVVVTYGVIMLVSSFLDPYISVVFGDATFLTNYFNSHIILLFGSQFIGVFALTILSSFFAMRKHLRV